MSELLDSNPALHGAIMFHGVQILKRLRELPRVQVQQLVNEARHVNQEQPSDLKEFAGIKRFQVPAYGPCLLSGAEVVALMVFGEWVLCGEDEKVAGPLVEEWPIREVLTGFREP